jgi:polyphosphate glucokinase
MQGLAVIRHKGLELVITLGTGVGSALFREGELMPHMELAHHPLHDTRTYNQYLGDKELKKIGRRKWNARVRDAIAVLETFLNFDHLYIGGGNAKRLDFKLPRHVTAVSNAAGLEGGAMLWRLRNYA